ncbi:MAG: glycogen/starch synthase, partial [Muribaculaceae bacterium]|nr:glycogen/starch synthase [Muribaculaceae bacterium]
MSAKRILLVSQEIAPYVPSGDIASLTRNIAQGVHSRASEVRTFMPKYGTVNERRNQLHEVIRLSGMNIPIDDNDHPLIIKVASLQPSRIQVYFIDNDDYFQKCDDDADAVGTNRTDNDERTLFFARGTIETVKK